VTREETNSHNISSRYWNSLPNHGRERSSGADAERGKGCARTRDWFVSTMRPGSKKKIVGF
jgi:hypothetical protein